MITIIDRVQTKSAYRDCCRIAAMAGEPQPANVNYGKVYKTRDGNFRIVCELAPPRSREIMFTYVERVEGED